MIELAKSFQPSKPNLRTPEAAPPLSPDTLSIAQQKTVQSALQFVVSMGICPYLLPGIGLPLQYRSEFGVLVCSVVLCDLPLVRARRLYITCMSLLEVSRHSSLGSLFFTQHLGDLMAGLCQLGYCPTKVKADQGTNESLRTMTEGERDQCQEALRGLLDRLYQPLVIRELLILQGGPRQGPRPSGAAASLQRAPAPSWLRHLCGQLLSERLMRPNGVQAVVRGILEDAGAGVTGGREAEAAASNWKKCDAIARVLASCPQQSISMEMYYRKVCPQILDLLHIQNSLTARQFQRVATETFLKMGRDQPQLSETYLILPMLKPLLHCTTAEAEKRPIPGETLISEPVLSQCVEDIVKVFVVGNDPTDAILNYSRQIILAIFSLYCFARQNASNIRSPCQDILLWFLEKSDRESAVSALSELSGMDSSLPSLPQYSLIKPGSEGGAMIIVREDQSDDDDDVLYERVTGEQWRLQCLVDLLSINPHTGLAADFFLYCLKRLTPIAAGEKEPDLSSSPEDSLLDLERKLTLRYQSQEKLLQLLQVLSVLCERVSNSIFTDVKQIVEFVLMTLERACTGLATSEGGIVASQTLSMAMGLIAAMLGVVELTSTDFGHLKTLIPVLEKVMQSHPEPVIQELASDLRITIATHCIAVLSRDIPEHILPILLAQYESAVSSKGKAAAPETRMKVGEALMRCTRTLGDMVLRHKDVLIHSFLRGCRDPDSSIRASSLSNLGELCKQLQFSLGPVLHEVTSCLSAVVHTDPEAQVRRAAIHVIVLLLRGLNKMATEVLRDVLLDLYRLLKFVVQCEKDSVSVLHAQLGLEELDSIMRTFLFPTQKLEKKIVVLPSDI
ncbi:hypothetical protein GDO78_001130 [Eleutherodactylus coqui]|uniref:Transport and golgi organization 6 homolog n=1 Tax=Eleutherodactylus coqui TaxID=57060 RepID=A0A8J6KN27_ELECQ|nr:hypothetical protein GDO78_001130 [Eleutherodactylus coqui]